MEEKKNTAVKYELVNRPSGDLISRADLPIKYLTLSSKETDGDGNVIQSRSTTWEVVMKTDIDNAPSADKSIGEWIEYKNFNGELKTYECSNCKHPQGYKTPYCCECGAKMKEAK